MKIKFTYIFLCILIILSTNHVFAQFNPEVLAKSTVRINIKLNGKVVSTATGFLWQNNNQVVTSLHVMKEGADIQIEFEGAKTGARVIKVLQEADLVLLYVDNPVQGWKSINSYDSNKPEYKSELSALGYNNGAPGLSTRELKKGFVKPEILKLLVPPDDRKVLINSKMPDINLPIYYLNGTLLPGFSGAPVVNKNGSLIGIGDGGLENGASAVSWVIPAKHLDELTKSNVTSLPASLSKSSLLFSADLDIQQEYISVKYKEFEFVKTKTRTFNQLLETADNPEELKYALSVFDDFKIDYSLFSFDIYEDGKFGLVITLPSGASLEVITDDDEDVLSATGDIYGEDGYYDIDFLIEKFTEAGTESETVEEILHQLADEYLAQLNEDEIDYYVEQTDYRIIEDYGDGKFVLRTEFNDFDNDRVETHEINYITFATDSQIYFLSRCVLNRFDEEFEDIFDKYEKIDCTQGNLNSEQQEVCLSVKEMLQIMTSVHLTSFSNKINKN